MTIPFSMLARGDDDGMKLLFALVFGAIWVIVAAVGAISKKNQQKGPKRSWEEILGGLSGPALKVPPTMPGKLRPQSTPQRPPPMPKAKGQRKQRRQPSAVVTMAPAAPPLPVELPPVVLETVAPAQPAPSLKRMSSGQPRLNARQLRQQVVISEILAKPLALREE